MSRGHVYHRRNLILLVGGNATSALGTSVYLIALVLYLTETTSSATILGAVQFLAYVPGVILGPIAGAHVDRVRRVSVIVAADVFRGVIVIVAGLFGLMTGSMPIALIFVVTVLYGAGSAFFLPAVNALVPEIVPAESVKRTNGWKNGLQQIANLAGNAVGGVLFAVLGAPVLFVANGLSFLLSAASEAAMRVDERPTPTSRASLFTSARHGLRYVRDHRGAAWLIGVSAAINFVAPPIVIAVPFLVIDGLGLPAQFVGFAFAALLAGGVFGFLVVGAGRNAAGFGTLISALAVLSVALTAGGAILGPVPLFVLLVVAGGAVATVHLIGHTAIQTGVPRFMRGRVYALLETAGMIAAPVAYLVSGPIVDRLDGEFAPLFIALGLAIGGVAVAAFSARSLRILIGRTSRSGRGPSERRQPRIFVD